VIGELRNTTPKYQNTSTQSRAFKTQKLISRVARKNSLKERSRVLKLFCRQNIV
jgi:hypothetical protein